MSKTRNWEMEYEKWNAGEYDARYEELTAKIEAKTCSKEELKEHKKMEITKGNVPKVKNILELRKKLQEESYSTDEQIARIKNKTKTKEQMASLEKEMEELKLEAQLIDSKLKNKDLSEEERKELEDSKQKNISKREENDQKFMRNQTIMSNLISKDDEKSSDSSVEELKAKKISLSTQISKCNMACNNLMQGKSWAAVEVKLDNWKERYTGKKDQAKEIADAINEYKDNKSSVMTKDAVQTDINAQQPKKEKEEIEDNLPVEHKTFAERHPRLAKIPFLAKIMDKIGENKAAKVIQEFDNNDKNDEKGNVDQINNDISKELGTKVNEILGKDDKNSKDSKDNDFRMYLREIAEKGMDGIEEEKKANARERLNAQTLKKANEYAERYGGRYNEQDGAKKDDGMEQGE